MEARLFEEGTVPAWTTPEWYAERDAAPHLEQEGHRERLLLASHMATNARLAVEDCDDARVQYLDLGAGDGGLLSILPWAKGFALGFDLQQSNVEAAKVRGVDVRLFDVVADDWSEYVAPETVLIACELLEHLIDPHGFVAKCFASGAKYAVFSSPYTETAEAHYDFHTWAWDLEGYRALVEGAGYRVIRQETAWICQAVLAVRP